MRFLFTDKNMRYASKIDESKQHEHKITSCFLKIPSKVKAPNGNKITSRESNIETVLFIRVFFLAKL
jgi:hypothetical protein